MSSRDAARKFAFHCARLDDPRRIQLRQGAFLDAYRRRGDACDLIEIGHQLTKLRRADGLHMRDALALFEQPHMLRIQFTQDREYPLHPTIRLPEAALPDRPFAELLRARRSCRAFGGGALGLAELAALLGCALGETARLTLDAGDQDAVAVSLRSIPSGGALHPTRLFVALMRGRDLEPGVYHFDAPEHALEMVAPLQDAECRALLAAFPVHPQVVDLEQAAALFFVSTKFWRPRAKYGPRGYRYCLQEAGSACQNLCLAAVALDLGHVVLGGFYDDEIHACLELDGVEHAVITAIAVGSVSAQQAAAPNHAGF